MFRYTIFMQRELPVAEIVVVPYCTLVISYGHVISAHLTGTTRMIGGVNCFLDKII